MTRILLIILGWSSVVVGVIGIFLPLIPTTPLLLLASWCFAKSSVRFHLWLHEHPRLGPIVKAWKSDEGINLNIKLRAVALIWVTMTASMLLINKPLLTAILITIGICVSIYLLILVPTKISASDS